jgi:hypothetical protein
MLVVFSQAVSLAFLSMEEFQTMLSLPSTISYMPRLLVPPLFYTRTQGMKLMGRRIPVLPLSQNHGNQTSWRISDKVALVHPRLLGCRTAGVGVPRKMSNLSGSFNYYRRYILKQFRWHTFGHITTTNFSVLSLKLLFRGSSQKSKL